MSLSLPMTFPLMIGFKEKTGLKISISMSYHFMHGNNLRTLSFVWRVPASGPEATANARLVTDLNAKQKVFSTRQMHRDYIERYSRMLKTSHKKKSLLLSY